MFSFFKIKICIFRSNSQIFFQNSSIFSANFTFIVVKNAYFSEKNQNFNVKMNAIWFLNPKIITSINLRESACGEQCCFWRQRDRAGWYTRCREWCQRGSCWADRARSRESACGEQCCFWWKGDRVWFWFDYILNLYL